MNHGTPAGDQAHKRRGEEPCHECVLARRQYQRERYWRRVHGVPAPPLPSEGSPTVGELVEDYLTTLGSATMGALHARIQDRHPWVQLEAVRQAVHRLKQQGIVDVTTGIGHDSAGRTARIYLYHID